MAWLNIKPENQGGGRQPKEPIAKLYSTGQFTLSHAAVAILGDPAKVRVQIEPDLRRIRLQPIDAMRANGALGALFEAAQL